MSPVLPSTILPGTIETFQLNKQIQLYESNFCPTWTSIDLTIIGKINKHR